MANAAAKIIKRIEDEEIEWVDLRFTDPHGKCSISAWSPPHSTKTSLVTD